MIWPQRHGDVQPPRYQKVNGIELVRWSLPAVGWTADR
jgi:hypothetical protein